MNLGRTVFAQLISFLPDREFRRCVSRYDGDHRWRSFSGWDPHKLFSSFRTDIVNLERFQEPKRWRASLPRNSACQQQIETKGLS